MWKRPSLQPERAYFRFDSACDPVWVWLREPELVSICSGISVVQSFQETALRQLEPRGMHASKLQFATGSRASQYVAVPTSVSQEQMDQRNYYGIINNSLNDSEGLIGASRYEMFLGRLGACWCFLPACSTRCQCSSWSLPAVQLKQVTASSVLALCETIQLSRP